MTSPLEWFDTHTHLEHEYPFDTEAYMKNAQTHGVRTMVTIGTTADNLVKLKEYSETYPQVYFTVGIHPHEAITYTDAVESEMRSLSAHPKCVGIGEIGLDYYYNHSPHEIQIQALERQLALAIELKKPVVIHARDAEEDLLKKLYEYSLKTSLKDRVGIIHCFSGTPRFAEECLKFGFYISFSGILTFKNASTLRDIAKTIPKDKILLETDSPFLAPIPYRGKPNQSAYLVETAKILAQTIGIPLEDLSRITVENSRRVFDL